MREENEELDEGLGPDSEGPETEDPESDDAPSPSTARSERAPTPKRRPLGRARRDKPIRPPVVGEAPARIIGGFRVPGRADSYKVNRFAEPGGRGTREACAIINVEGVRVDKYTIQDDPPSWESIMGIWGSGNYRLAWLGWDEKAKRRIAVGTSEARSFDHPDFPKQPAVRKIQDIQSAAQLRAGVVAAPQPPPTSLAPPPATALTDPMTQLVMSLAGDKGGTLNAGVAIALISMANANYQNQLHAMEERERRWRREDEERSREREEEHRRRLERERAVAAEDRERIDAIYRRSRTVERTDDPALSRLEERLDDMDERFDDDREPGQEPSMAEKIAEYAPLVPIFQEALRGVLGPALAIAPSAGAPSK